MSEEPPVDDVDVAGLSARNRPTRRLRKQCARYGHGVLEVPVALFVVLGIVILASSASVQGFVPTM
jgi:hypothetical protein